MKIMQIIIGLDVGGAEMMLKRLVESHHGNPIYQHSVVSLTDIGKLGAQFQTMGIDVNTLGMNSVFSIPLVLLRLVGLIRANQPDIVQTWMYHADLLGGLAACIAGNRYVIWGVRTTDIQLDGSFMTAIARRLCARLSSWIPSVIVCAAEASKQFHVEVGYDATKMSVVPNGYNFSWLKASFNQRELLRQQYGIDQNNLVLGSLGRFHADKDQKNFVLTSGLLASKFSQLRFLMIGRGVDWKNRQLSNWIVDTGFKERFVLLGERDDVPQCLAAMDIFCLHSKTEGFPNVLAEAMAMSLPCISTDVGDAAMLLAETGVVVPKENSAALAQGVEQLLVLDQSTRSALGMQAKSRVEMLFSMDNARERFEEIYRQVSNKETF